MHVYMRELVDRDVDDHAVLTGRFLVSTGAVKDGLLEEVEYPSLLAALEWARDRADSITVDLEDAFDGRRFSATGDAELPPLGAAQLEWAATGRRRYHGEEWLDRTELDDPLLWLVEADIHPDVLVRRGSEHDAQRRVLEQVEAGIVEAGFAEVFVDVDSLDETLAEIDREAEVTGALSGVTAGSLAFELHAVVMATTWRAAVKLAVETIEDALGNATGKAPWTPGADHWPEDGRWGVSATAWPADGAPPGPPPV